MVSQTLPRTTRVWDSPDDTLGIPAQYTVPGDQSDCFKELVNKLAWAIGSTYRKPYRGRKSLVREEAIKVATSLIGRQGYPESIKK